jgi:hypothetical protein
MGNCHRESDAVGKCDRVHCSSTSKLLLRYLRQASTDIRSTIPSTTNNYAVSLACAPARGPLFTSLARFLHRIAKEALLRSYPTSETAKHESVASNEI